uniref:Uncharacterized protein n=1 Tax=Romanomermis culicivorax TaxID=13658 RepID=A0A915K3B8_ROMCU
MECAERFKLLTIRSVPSKKGKSFWFNVRRAAGMDLIQRLAPDVSTLMLSLMQQVHYKEIRRVQPT